MYKKVADFCGVTTKRDARKNMALGIMGGLMAGAALGLLFAPKPGKELRQDIRQTAGCGVERVKEAGAQAQEFIKKQIAKLNEEALKLKAATGKEAQQLAAQVADRAEEVAAKVGEIVDQA